MANEVKITVTADDQASDKITGIASSFGNLKQTIAGTAIGFAAIQAGQQAMSALGDTISNAMKAAKDYNVVQAQTAAVLQSTGGVAGMTAEEIQNLASELEQLSGVDEVAIQGAENLLLTFTNIGRDVFPQATQTILDMSVALGQDLKSSAIQVGKALQDPVDGITALRRVGVNFSDAQRDVIEAMVKSGDAASAQALILKELQTEFGGSAQAAEDARGGINRSKDAFDDAARSLAIALTPAVNKTMGAFYEITGAVLQSLLPAFKFLADNMDKIAPIVAGIGVAIGMTLLPKMLLATAAIWAQVAALTAQAIAFATANPWLAAAAVAAGVATAAFLG